jgi:hypothetical protein
MQINDGQTPTFHKFETGLTLLFKFPESLHLYSTFYFPCQTAWSAWSDYWSTSQFTRRPHFWNFICCLIFLLVQPNSLRF